MHDVRLDLTVESFRKEYCRKQGTEAEYCRLLFSGKELEDVRNGKGKYKMKWKKWLLLFGNNRFDIYIYCFADELPVCWEISYDLERLWYPECTYNTPMFTHAFSFLFF